MDQELQTLWALAAAQYPELDPHDYDAVHRTLGPAFGPWRSAAVGAPDRAPAVLLAAGGVVEDVAQALTAIAVDWLRLAADDGDSGRVPAFPDPPTAGDVARHAPYGLLVRHGLARLSGTTDRVDVPAERPLRLGGSRVTAPKG